METYIGEASSGVVTGAAINQVVALYFDPDQLVTSVKMIDEVCRVRYSKEWSQILNCQRDDVEPIVEYVRLSQIAPAKLPAGDKKVQ